MDELMAGLRDKLEIDPVRDPGGWPVNYDACGEIGTNFRELGKCQYFPEE